MSTQILTASPGAASRTATIKPRKAGLRQYILAAAGFLAGAVVYELAFVPFLASWHYPKTPVRSIGQWNEGVALSHFIPDGIGTYGRRLTGNPPVPNATRITILGDSHITQAVVPDDQTAGSVLEKIARAQHRPVNVFQYGWDGACAAAYIGSAPDVLAATHADHVVVLMNALDFGSQLLTGEAWHLLPRPDGSWELKDVRKRQDNSGKVRWIERLAGSRLLLAIQRRTNGILENMHATPGGPRGMVEGLRRRTWRDPITPEVAASVSIRGLKEAYGDKLFVLYTPFCGIRCSQTPEAEEAALEKTCAVEGVRCLSMRNDIIEEARRTFRLTRGFSNTSPGEGHLNSTGLALAAQIIYRELAPALPSR